MNETDDSLQLGFNLTQFKFIKKYLRQKLKHFCSPSEVYLNLFVVARLSGVLGSVAGQFA